MIARIGFLLLLIDCVRTWNGFPNIIKENPEGKIKNAKV